MGREERGTEREGANRDDTEQTDQRVEEIHDGQGWKNAKVEFPHQSSLRSRVQRRAGREVLLPSRGGLDDAIVGEDLLVVPEGDVVPTIA